MDTDEPAPEFFVARDRARRFARYIRDALQERRLHYRGADVGMETLSDEADEALGAVIDDINATVAGILAGRLRDRERAFMEVPLVTAAEGVADRVLVARQLDRTQARAIAASKAARAQVLELLDDALLRIDAYCGAYDEKRPIGPLRATDVAHLLERVEAGAHARASVVGGDAPAPAFDRPPPPIRSDPNGLDDVLRAARAAAVGAVGPWRVEPAGPGRPLVLAFGTAPDDAVDVPPPERLARAVEVLAFLHPVSVACRGQTAAAAEGLLSSGPGDTQARIDCVVLHLADDAAGRVELTVGAAAGGEARLPPDAEAAVRALMQSPPLPESGPPAPQRLVALMGLLRSLDTHLDRALVARARTNACKVAASRLPRESTRKAPLKRSLLAALEDRFPDLPAHRAEALAADAAAGRVARRNANAADAAVLLALLARDDQLGGATLRRVMDLAPLEAAAIDATILDLGAIAAVRRQLERGSLVESALLTRLEQACIAVLGRLGRLPELP